MGSTTSGSDAFQKVRVGMFYADCDVKIANRIRDGIDDLGCNVELCDLLDCGNSKVQSVEDFLSSKDAILWLATEKSMDDKMMAFMQSCGLYKAIVDSRFRFILLQPKEHLKLKLPTILDAYTPLREDGSFTQRVRSTLNSIAKKISDRPPGNSTQNQDNDERIEGMEVGFEKEVGVCTKPAPALEEQSAEAAGARSTTYNINIIGDNNIIQVGPQNQVLNAAEDENVT